MSSNYVFEQSFGFAPDTQVQAPAPINVFQFVNDKQMNRSNGAMVADLELLARHVQLYSAETCLFAAKKG